MSATTTGPDSTRPDPTGRVVLVTGGGTGIGAACAATLAGRGDTVVICGRRPDALTSSASATGATPIVCDVAEVAALVAWLLSAEASYVNGAMINIDGGLGAVDAGVLPFLSA